MIHDWDCYLSYRDCYLRAIIFFCEKTTVLAEKVFHPAAGEAQLTALCHMLSLFYQAE